MSLPSLLQSRCCSTVLCMLALCLLQQSHQQVAVLNLYIRNLPVMSLHVSIIIVVHTYLGRIRSQLSVYSCNQLPLSRPIRDNSVPRICSSQSTQVIAGNHIPCHHELAQLSSTCLASICKLWVQDGYAVVASDGPGEYVVAFEAHAGIAQQRLESGTVAYITTGILLTCAALRRWVLALAQQLARHHKHC